MGTKSACIECAKICHIGRVFFWLMAVHTVTRLAKNAAPLSAAVLKLV